MLTKRKYYYLVAGLPDIELDGDKRTFNFGKLITEIKEALHPNDKQAIMELFLINDFFNFFYLLDGKKIFNTTSTFTLDELNKFTENQEEKEPEDRILVPEYFLTIKEYYNKSKDEDSAKNIIKDYERFLWELFINKIVKRSKYRFIPKWYDVEVLLKNMQAAYLSRKKKLLVNEYLIGDNEWIPYFTSNNSPDFGIKEDVDIAHDVFQTFEISNIKEREFKLDVIRWNKLDEITNEDYFNLDKILSFIIKMSLLERWLQLDKQKGMLLFENFLNELKTVKN